MQGVHVDGIMFVASDGGYRRFSIHFDGKTTWQALLDLASHLHSSVRKSIRVAAPVEFVAGLQLEIRVDPDALEQTSRAFPEVVRLNMSHMQELRLVGPASGQAFCPRGDCPFFMGVLADETQNGPPQDGG